MRTMSYGRAVMGATLGISRFGAGTSKADFDQEVDAKLTFLAGFLQKASEPDGLSFEKFASLSGRLLVAKSNRTPVFTIGGPIEYESPPPEPVAEGDEPAPPPRLLRLQYASPDFAASNGEGLAELRLPEVPEGAHFLEIGVELELGGAVESGVEQNDRLDVPLDLSSFFRARIADQNDVPFANHPYDLEQPDGTIVSGKTDADGRLELNPCPKGFCVVRLPEDAVEAEAATGAG